MQHSYKIPSDSNWESGPYVSSWKGRQTLQKAIPLFIKISIEAAKAAELVMGQHFKPNSSGKTKIPTVNDKDHRIGCIIARAGIISQFELWKSYAATRRLPCFQKAGRKVSLFNY